MKNKFLLYTIIQFCLLMSFWLMLSGHYDFFHISLGVFSVIIVMTINWRFRKYYFFKDEMFKTSKNDLDIKGFRFVFYYVPWLLWQILIASLQVALVVLSPKMPIDPSLVRFKTKLKKITSKVILGNSITLTPGTITVDIAGDDFLVHSLMDVSFSGIEDDSLPTQVAKLYDKNPGHIVYNIKIMKSKKEV